MKFDIINQNGDSWADYDNDGSFNDGIDTYEEALEIYYNITQIDYMFGSDNKWKIIRRD